MHFSGVSPCGKVLIIFAGYYPDEIEVISAAIKKANLVPDVLFLPFGYAQTAFTNGYISISIRNIVGRIVKTILNKPETISPSNVVVIYCPRHNVGLFLEKISIFAACYCVESKRETPGDIGRDVIFCINQNKILRPHLHSKSSQYLLPLRNFIDPNQKKSLYEIYRMAIYENLNNPKIFQHVDISLTSASINSRRMAVFIDSRDLFFIVARAMHGLPSIENEDESSLLLGITGLYRFGSPIPDGFHYDVQYSPEKPLFGVTFFCQRSKKEVNSSAKYINVYPNDVVRG